MTRVAAALVLVIGLVLGAVARDTTAARTTASHIVFLNNRDGDHDVYALHPAGRRLAAIHERRFPSGLAERLARR